MRQRTRFWTTGLLLALLGGFVATPASAETSLRWGTPNVNGAGISAKPTISPYQAPTVPIQQVRYNRQELPGLPEGPSQEALIDTQFPESNPGFTTPPAQAPTPQRSDASLFGNGMNAADNGRFPESDLYDEDEDMDNYGDSDGQKGVVINCPEGNILKPISDIDYDIRLKPGDMFPKECGLTGDDSPFPSRDWGRICFMWKASALCHKPLYFEEEALERYGHTLVQEEFQPFISGAKFFLTVPLLPYKMGINPPNECIYTLGHYRPGSCAPYMIDPFPISLRAGLIQAGAIVGGVAIFP